VSQSFEERLEELREKFRERAIVESATIEGMAEELSAGSAPAGLAAELRQIAHRLAGAGGTFGFAEISARATELEALLLDQSAGEEVAERCLALVSVIRQAA
jgi:HPt (histidine-containing phosphotransfer) domain-containing protein